MKLVSVTFGNMQFDGDLVDTITRKQYDYDCNRIWLKSGMLYVTQQPLTLVYKECGNDRDTGTDNSR